MAHAKNAQQIKLGIISKNNVNVCKEAIDSMDNVGYVK